MPYQYRPLEFNSFKGGFTDNYVNAAPDRCQFMKNFYILNNESMKTRFGTVLDVKSLADSQIPIGSQRINTLMNYKNDTLLFVHSGKRVYYRNPTAYSTVTSTVNSDLFSTADAQTHLGHTEWNGHLIITPETFDKPIKIYKDSANLVQARTAGLPLMTPAPTIPAFLGTAISCTINGAANQVSTGVTPHGLVTGNPIKFTTGGGGFLPAPLVVGTVYYVIEVSATVFQVALTEADALGGNFIDILNNSVGPVFYGKTNVGDGSFVYSVFYSYEYTVGTQTFIDFGPTTLIQKSDVTSPDYLPIDLNLSALVNGVGDHYDTANVKIQIFRTVENGQEFYKVAEVANGTASYSDTLSDELLQDNETIYTSGGVPNNDPPPRAKYCHTINNVTYYAHLKEGTEVFPSLVRQSQQLDPDSVPNSFFDELEDEITGLSSVQEVPIVGCRKHIYKIEGTFDLLGRGGMSHVRLSDHAGCLSHESFVQAEGALFWFGDDGVYYTEGFRCMKVTDHLNTTYKKFKKNLVDKTRKIKGVYNPEFRSIYWTISQKEKLVGQEECDSIFVLDLSWGISDEMPCHIWEGSAAFNPTSLIVFNRILNRADKTGYVLQFLEDTATDPKIIAGTDPTTWYEDTIIYQWRGITSNFGGSHTRKIANKLLVDLLGISTQSVQITAINDEGRLVRPFTPIRWRKGFIWGDDDFVWGDPNFTWYYGGVITVDRRFPAKGLRFNHLQIDITNAFINIVNSDLIGTATVDGVLDTVSLDTVGNKWPAQAVDYVIYFESDNYTRGYTIVSRTDTTLVVSDPLNVLVTGSQKWQIKGYKKGEIMNLVNISISAAETSRSFDTFNQGESGGLE